LIDAAAKDIEKPHFGTRIDIVDKIDKKARRKLKKLKK